MAARKFKFVSPGVFLKEIDNSQLPKLPGGVGPVVIGRTKKGPSLKPLKVNSFQDYVRIFGETVPGNQGTDTWRDGNGQLATAYAPYAAQAYLNANIQSPVTVIRLAGIAGDDAVGNDAGAKHPGWAAERAFGIFATPQHGADDHGGTDVTSSAGLVGIIYTTDANIQVGFKGSGHREDGITGSVGPGHTGDYEACLTSSAATACGTVMKPNADGTHSIVINLHNGSNAITSGVERKISFSEGATYIRDVLNTNPVKTNSRISREVSGTLAHKYWLGETFEEEFNRIKSTLSGSANGVCLFTMPLGGNANHEGLRDFKSTSHQASPGKTGWVFDQHVGPHASFDADNQQKLFRVISLHEGESPSRDMIIGIENIRIPEVGAVDPFSTFAVVVKKVAGTRLEELERFDGCNLNPNSQNFIARKIGNQYFIWSTTEKRNKVYGSYPNVSDHIRIEMDPDVLEGGPLNPSAAPFGFFGPPVPADFTTAALGSDDTIGIAADASFLSGSITMANYQGEIKFSFPQFPLIHTGSLRDPMFGVTPFKQTHVSGSPSAEGSVVNPGYVDFCRRMSSYASSALLKNHDTGFNTGAKSKYSFAFTLDDVYTTGSTPLDNDLSDYTPSTIEYKSGQRVAGLSATSIPGVTPSILTRELFDSFQMPLVGGFEGVDITEADPFNMEIVNSAATTATNYAYASIDRAIELIRDPEALEMNLAVMPGISNESLTTKLVETCEARADALAIIDLPGVYVPPFEKKCDNFEQRLTTTPAKAARALTARQLNSSYGATYYPWVKVRDSIYTRDVWVPPSVVALGVMAYTEERNEVWFAPAGFNRGGLNEGNAGLAVLQVTEQLLSKHRDVLYEANINPIASFVTEGLVVFGQKTLQTTQSALDRINVRRLLIFVKKEVSRISNGLLFDQNLPATWNRFKSQVVPFLESVKSRLGLSDFRVILDETTTTPDLVDRNIMYAKIFLKPARAIEFIAVDFVITNTGASFDD